MNKAIKKEKKFEFILGLFFLIPPFLGVCFFLLSLCDVSGHFVNMYDLSGQWDKHGDSTPPAPIYLGLMAIAGALLVKNSLRYLLSQDDNAENTIDKQEMK